MTVYKHQFGFQKNKLTKQAVLDLYTRVTNAFDKGNSVCSVFGYVKGSGTVDQKILLSKLQHYGLGELLRTNLSNI